MGCRKILAYVPMTFTYVLLTVELFLWKNIFPGKMAQDIKEHDISKTYRIISQNLAF